MFNWLQKMGQRGGHPMLHAAEANRLLAELPRDGVDLLVLCTDGLHGVLSNDTIGAELTRSAAEPLEARANALLQAAMVAGARDNVTVLLVALEAGALR